MRRPALALVLLCAACKQAPHMVDSAPPASVALPPGEEFVPPSGRDFEAEAMAEPLQPDPEQAAEMTPEDLRKWEASVRFERGEAVDFDGDGYKESVGKWVDGHFTSTIDGNGDGIPDETSDGTRSVADTDFDGRPDHITTTSRRSNGGVKVVREEDTDRDGVFDWRYTTEQLAPHRERIIQERLGDDGAWHVQEDYEASTIKRMQVKKAAGEQALSGMTDQDVEECIADFPNRFPTDLGNPARGTKGVRIPFGRDSKRCNKAQSARVNKALECVRRKVDACLTQLNPGVASALRRFIDGRKGVDDPKAWETHVSCGNTCGVGGMTEREASTYTAKIELPSDLLLHGDADICEALFHELLHAVGMPAGRDHDSLGTDQLYSCARVCSGCNHWSIGSGDDRRDCAVCASPVLNKGVCGVKPVVGSVGIADNPASCFRTPPAVGTAACDRRGVAFSYCDDTRVAANPTWCCESCPAGYSIVGSGLGGWCAELRGDSPWSTCWGPLSLCGA